MESTQIFRAGALALSTAALVFVVWTAAAPGCAPSEPARPDSTPTAGATPSTVSAVSSAVPSASTAPEQAASASENAPVDPPRFMGASKAAPVWDDGHMPVKPKAAPTHTTPNQAATPPGGSK